MWENIWGTSVTKWGSFSKVFTPHLSLSNTDPNFLFSASLSLSRSPSNNRLGNSHSPASRPERWFRVRLLTRRTFKAYKLYHVWSEQKPDDSPPWGLLTRKYSSLSFDDTCMMHTKVTSFRGGAFLAFWGKFMTPNLEKYNHKIWNQKKEEVSVENNIRYKTNAVRWQFQEVIGKLTLHPRGAVNTVSMGLQ